MNSSFTIRNWPEIESNSLEWRIRFWKVQFVERRNAYENCVQSVTLLSARNTVELNGMNPRHLLSCYTRGITDTLRLVAQQLIKQPAKPFLSVSSNAIQFLSTSATTRLADCHAIITPRVADGLSAEHAAVKRLINLSIVMAITIVNRQVILRCVIKYILP